MHPYLMRLGVRPEVQEFFEPHFRAHEDSGLVFNYGDALEHYGFAFHRVPFSDNHWMAGNTNFNMVSRVFLCSSAMEAIAFYHYHYASYPHFENLLFISLGITPNNNQFRWLYENLPGKQFRLVFGSGLLERAGDLKTAAALMGLPLNLTIGGDQVVIQFRLKTYKMPADSFSLSAFEKLSGCRFRVKTMRPKNGGSYFGQLQAAAFNQKTYDTRKI